MPKISRLARADGLPLARGLRNRFLFEWYQEERGSLPGGRGRTKRLKARRRAVVRRWWRALPPQRQAEYSARVVSFVRTWNEEIAVLRADLDQRKAALCWRIERLKRGSRQ